MIRTVRIFGKSAAPLAVLALCWTLAACGQTPTAGGQGRPQNRDGISGAGGEGRPGRTIVVSYSILGSVVKELAGSAFTVRVLVPNGLDVHEWEPSARDIEALNRADLVVVNGLGLEGGMEKALTQARASGRRFFVAGDHIAVRRVGRGEGLPNGDPDQAEGAEDPHLWTDPRAMASVAAALKDEILKDFGIDLSAGAASLISRLGALDTEIREKTSALPPEKRRLVTGHESLGYFAAAYNFRLIGAVVPSLSSDAEASAAGLAALKKLIVENKVRTVFTETGTPKQVVDALAADSGVKVMSLATHSLPADGSYFSFERQLADDILKGLE